MPKVVLITGMQAAGKSTVDQAGHRCSPDRLTDVLRQLEADGLARSRTALPL